LLLLPVLRLDRSDNDKKFVAFGRKKNTGISQINGLDDLCQGRPSKAKAKAKDFASRPRPRTCSRKAKAKATNFGLKAKAKD